MSETTKVIDSHRTLQEITDISIKNGTFKSLDLDEIKAMGHKLIADVGVYDVIKEECQKDLFYFIDTVLNRVGGLDPETNIRKFEYSRARHFQWGKYLIDAKFPPQVDFEDMYRFRSSKDAGHPYHICKENSWHNNKLILLPRNHGKTRVFNTGYNMWRLLKNPNMRILILSETRQNAVDMLFMIKDLYVKIRDSRNTEDFIAYYVMGDWVGDQWNEDAIRVKPRSVSELVPSIATAGVESEITSKHFDLICCDDVVGEQNVTTPEQILKHKAKISRLTEVGDYDHRSITDYIFLGTRWHYSDYYSVILDELTDIYDILKLGCWDIDTHEPLFPEKYSNEVLEGLRRKKLASPNPEEWSNQWLNEPLDSPNATFARDSLNIYDNIAEILKGSFVAIFGDTAWTEHEWSDETAFVPIAFSSYNYRYVLPYENFKTNKPEVVANRLISLAAPYYEQNRFKGAFVEEGPFFSAIFPILADKAPWLRLIPLHIKNRNKDALILNIASLTTYKKLFIRKNMHDLIEQLIRWPRYDKKDIINAVAYQFDPYPITSMPKASPEKPYPTNEESFQQQQKMDDEKSTRRHYV